MPICGTILASHNRAMFCGAQNILPLLAKLSPSINVFISIVGTGKTICFVQVTESRLALKPTTKTVGVILD